MKLHSTRRSFLKLGGTIAGLSVLPHASFAIHNKARLVGEIVGQGNFTYRVDKHWGIQDPGKIPVRHCHEMVQDRQGKLYMTTTHTRNNIIIYHDTGRVYETWGTEYPGAHGLTLAREGEKDFLFITDTERHKVFKTTLSGRVLRTIEYPKDAGIYQSEEEFVPTEVAVAPNGDFYVTDGYGKNYIIQYDHYGRYIRHFGGKGDGEDQFDCCHGIAVDLRNPKDPCLLITSRSAQEFKRFTLDGEYIETIPVGSWICRPVIKGDMLYFAALATESWWEYDGVLLVMDRNYRLIAAPGAKETQFGGTAMPRVTYDGRTFMNPHDVCVDRNDNLYVPQWFSGNTYPLKLSRV